MRRVRRAHEAGACARSSSSASSSPSRSTATDSSFSLSCSQRVIFFGESLEPLTRRLSEHLVSTSSQLLVAGSSLATFSAFRLVRQAKEQGSPVGLVNIGESRGDPLVDWRVGWEGGAGDVFPLVVRELLRDEKRAQVKAEVERMLTLGTVKKVLPGPPTG